MFKESGKLHRVLLSDSKLLTMKIQEKTSIIKTILRCKKIKRKKNPVIVRNRYWTPYAWIH